MIHINYNRYSLDPILDQVRATLKTHELGEPGKYARWIWQNEEQNRDLGVNAYGCADALNILYTIGEFPSTERERRSWIKHMQALQVPETGEFPEGTHFTLHTTAHCIAALELLDQKPLYRLQFIEKYLEKENLYHLLDNLKWLKSPWNNSHIGAGIYVSLVLSGMADSEWRKWYFDWLYHEADPETGMWRKGYITSPDTAPFHWHMASTFHYLFNHEYEKMPLRYPEKLVDSCLDIFYTTPPETLGQNIGFLEIDWIYCINRAFRQCGHRTIEVKQAIADFAHRLFEYLMSIHTADHDSFNDLHLLFGTVSALAELSQSVYGIYEVKKPLRLVLDRRPFI